MPFVKWAVVPLHAFETFAKYQMAAVLLVCFQVLCSIGLSVLCQYPAIFITMSLSISLLVFFLLRIAVMIHSLFVIPYKFPHCFFFPSSVKNSIGILMDITLNLQINFGDVAIFMMLTAISSSMEELFPLSLSSLVSFPRYSCWSCYDWDTLINIFVISLQIYMKGTHFCMFVLNPETKSVYWG